MPQPFTRASWWELFLLFRCFKQHGPTSISESLRSAKLFSQTLPGFQCHVTQGRWYFELQHVHIEKGKIGVALCGDLVSFQEPQVLRLKKKDGWYLGAYISTKTLNTPKLYCWNGSLVVLRNIFTVTYYSQEGRNYAYNSRNTHHAGFSAAFQLQFYSTSAWFSSETACDLVPQMSRESLQGNDFVVMGNHSCSSAPNKRTPVLPHILDRTEMISDDRNATDSLQVTWISDSRPWKNDSTIGVALDCDAATAQLATGRAVWCCVNIATIRENQRHIHFVSGRLWMCVLSSLGRSNPK